MKKKRFTEGQIIQFLHKAESGLSVTGPVHGARYPPQLPGNGLGSSGHAGRGALDSPPSGYRPHVGCVERHTKLPLRRQPELRIFG